MKKSCSKNRPIWIQAAIVLLVPLCLVAGANATRIKDITQIQGVRQNQLVGYGLVVGLNGTGDGDKAKFTIQSLASMLEKMGMTVNPATLKVKNVAAVMITANMQPFSRPGSRMDVSVSSIGDAKDLQGGTLLFTPLKAADGQTYAIAQGQVSTGGFSVQGAGGGTQKNFPTVGRVVGGALIEKEVSNQFQGQGKSAADVEPSGLYNGFTCSRFHQYGFFVSDCQDLGFGRHRSARSSQICG